MRRNKASNSKVAKEHVAMLLEEAEKNFLEYPQISRRQVELARKMAMKYRVRFDSVQKRKFCKRCSAYLKQGINSTVRLKNGKIILTCKECGFVRRWIYVRK
jgi:ribonuclease P protein subunit RPR2